MSVPPVGSVPPPPDTTALLDFQINFQGVTFGAGAQGVDWTEMDGLDVENIRTGDNANPRDQGERIGYDFLNGRDVTLTFDAVPPTDGTLQQSLGAVSSAFLPQSNQESPFYLALPYWGTLGFMARPRNRSWKVDYPYSVGKISQKNTFMVHATDPRFYFTPTQSGIWAGSNAASQNPITFTNEGNFDCRPRITLYGPAVNPGIACSPFGRVGLFWNPLSVTIGEDTYTYLPAGYQIQIDCYYQTLELVTPTVHTLVAADGDILSYDLTTFIGSGVLYVASLTDLTDSGVVTVTCGDGYLASVSYTGTNTTGDAYSLTGCQLQLLEGGLGTTYVNDLVGQNSVNIPLSSQLYPGSTWFTLLPGASTLSYYFDYTTFSDFSAYFVVVNTVTVNETTTAVVSDWSTVATLLAGTSPVVITGLYIPEGTTVVSIDGENLLMSNAATGSGDVELTFQVTNMYVEWASAVIL